MKHKEFVEAIGSIETDAKRMKYFRSMFRFAFERGVALGLNHELDTLTDSVVTARLNAAIADWNAREAHGEKENKDDGN